MVARRNDFGPGSRINPIHPVARVSALGYAACGYTADDYTILCERIKRLDVGISYVNQTYNQYCNIFTATSYGNKSNDLKSVMLRQVVRLRIFFFRILLQLR